MPKNKLSHINRTNNPAMVDVSHKTPSLRTAHACSVIVLPEEVMSALVDGDIKSSKGPVFQTAIIAGIMASKKTSELIPFCHPIGLDDCKIDIHINSDREVIIDCKVSVYHKTGVEMEALTAASVAALTIYDMCKGLSHGIVIKETRLMKKSGGKSDYIRK